MEKPEAAIMDKRAQACFVGMIAFMLLAWSVMFMPAIIYYTIGGSR